MVAEESLITEEMKQAVNVPSEPVTYEIERGLIKQFAQSISDPNPLWQDEVKARETRNGGIVAPPTFLRTCTPRDLKRLPYMDGLGLDGGSEWTYYRSVRPGDSVTVTQRITSFVQKNSSRGPMLIETAETSYKNQYDELVATQATVGIYY